MTVYGHPPAEIRDIAQRLIRQPEGHKGTYGRALILGGSRGMSGAAALAGMAALRSGAGLVQVATSGSVQAIVAGFNPCYLTSSLPEDADGRIVASALSQIHVYLTAATAAAIGPGLGRSEELEQLVAAVYESALIPLVVDADALNALAERKSFHRRAESPRILTPHPGEFSRLTGRATAEVQANRQSLAREFAAQHEAIVVLKGHETVITDGKQLSVNPTGNPGMATGGTGDILTGVITALLAQGIPAYDAARLGVWLHGAAGDAAAAQLGQVCLTAQDLLDYLPAAFSSVCS